MQTYRAFFLARGDEVLDTRSFEAADNRAAEVKAKEFCRDHPGAVAVEIWERGWLLSRHLLTTG